MSRLLYRTLKPIDTLNLTIPVGSFIKLKYTPEGDSYSGSSYYEFVGLFSGLTKFIPDNEVVFDSYLQAGEF